MACSDHLDEAIHVTPKIEAAKDEDFVEGIIVGIKDFAEGRYTVLKDDDELEAHLMGL
jgi:hypothetical protein